MSSCKNDLMILHFCFIFRWRLNRCVSEMTHLAHTDKISGTQPFQEYTLAKDKEEGSSFLIFLWFINLLNYHQRRFPNYSNKWFLLPWQQKPKHVNILHVNQYHRFLCPLQYYNRYCPRIAYRCCITTASELNGWLSSITALLIHQLMSVLSSRS